MSERRHSSACVDATEFDGVEHCICLPDEEAPAPDKHELWWCSYCGEPSCEDSDPCQRCGEKIERVPLVKEAWCRADQAQRMIQWLRGRTGAHGGAFTSADDVADALAREFGGGRDAD